MQNSFEELMPSLEDSHAKITALLESVAAFEGIEEPYGGSFTVSLASLMQGLSDLKTYPAYYPRVVESTSETLSIRWWNSGIASRGGFLTFVTSESPSGGGESSLSAVLEDDVPDKYNLSPRACAGILRRAEKRGKKIPETLRVALEAVAAQEDTTPV